MKIVIAATDGMPEAVLTALGSKEFAKHSLKVIENNLNARETSQKPAEYCVQKPHITTNLGALGVSLTLKGVSRETRASEQFHRALQALHDLAEAILVDALKSAKNAPRVQLFCTMELDGDIKVPDAWGRGYSRLLEHPPVWLSAAGVEKGHE